MFVDDFVILYFYLEGLGFSTYILLGLACNQYIRYEGVLKYFILNSFASILFLFGTTFIYFYTATTSFSVIMCLLNAEISSSFSGLAVINIGLIFILFSFFFKLGVFPCLLWIIDIYESIPLPFLFLLLTLYKFVLLIIFIKILTQVFFMLYYIWQPILLISAIGSLGFGCIGALLQFKLKRFIGYTSINQIGYIILSLSCNTNESLLTTYNFLIFYIMVNTLFFNFLLIASLSIKNYIRREFYYLTDLTNVSYYCNNSLIFTFVITVAAIISLPPIANFFIKYDILINIITIQAAMLVILVVLVLSVISAFYYIRLLKILFFNNLVTKWYQSNKQFVLNSRLNEIIIFYLLYLSQIIYVNIVNGNRNRHVIITLLRQLDYGSDYLITIKALNSQFTVLIITVDLWTIVIMYVIF